MVIIDDLFNNEDLIMLNKLFESGKNLWAYDSETTPGAETTDDTQDSGHIVLPLVSNNQINVGCRDIVTSVVPQIDKVSLKLRKLGHAITAIYRIKLNVTFQNRDAHENSHNLRHIDEGYEDDVTYYVTALVYPRDTDGDFYVFTEEGTGRVAPKKGRTLVFPSSYPHAGNNPRQFNDRRAINFIFECVKNESPSTEE